MLYDAALDLTLRDVLLFSRTGRTGRDAVDIAAIVEGLRALEHALTRRESRFEQKSREWFAGVAEEALERAITKHGERGTPRRKARKTP